MLKGLRISFNEHLASVSECSGKQVKVSLDVARNVSPAKFGRRLSNEIDAC